ncbi:unnamed protein product [Leuciscus chuanchicus]
MEVFVVYISTQFSSSDLSRHESLSKFQLQTQQAVPLLAQVTCSPPGHCNSIRPLFCFLWSGGDVEMGDAQGRLIKDDCSSGRVAGGDVEEVDRLIVLQEESVLRLTESS